MKQKKRSINKNRLKHHKRKRTPNKKRTPKKNQKGGGIGLLSAVGIAAAATAVTAAAYKGFRLISKISDKDQILNLLNQDYISYSPKVIVTETNDYMKHYLECITSEEFFQIILSNPDYLKSKTIQSIIKNTSNEEKTARNLLDKNLGKEFGDLENILNVVQSQNNNIMKNLQLDPYSIESNKNISELKDLLLLTARIPGSFLDSSELNIKDSDELKKLNELNRINPYLTINTFRWQDVIYSGIYDEYFTQSVEIILKERNINQILNDDDKKRIQEIIMSLSDNLSFNECIRNKMIECSTKPRGFLDFIKSNITWDSQKNCLSCPESDCLIYIYDFYYKFLLEDIDNIQIIDKLYALMICEARICILSKCLALEAIRIQDKNTDRVISVINEIYSNDKDSKNQLSSEIPNNIMNIQQSGGGEFDGGMQSNIMGSLNPPQSDLITSKSDVVSQSLSSSGEGMAPSGGDAAIPSGEGMAPSGEGMAPSGEGMVPSGEDMTPSGEGMAPSGEGMAPSGEGMNPSGGDAAIPSGEGISPSGEGITPSGGDATISSGGDAVVPSGEGMDPSGGNAVVPSGGEMTPSGEGMTSSGGEMTPSGGDVAIPSGEGMDPSGGNPTIQSNEGMTLSGGDTSLQSEESSSEANLSSLDDTPKDEIQTDKKKEEDSSSIGERYKEPKKRYLLNKLRKNIKLYISDPDKKIKLCELLSIENTLDDNEILDRFIKFKIYSDSMDDETLLIDVLLDVLSLGDYDNQNVHASIKELYELIDSKGLIILDIIGLDLLLDDNTIFNSRNLMGDNVKLTSEVNKLLSVDDNLERGSLLNLILLVMSENELDKINYEIMNILKLLRSQDSKNNIKLFAELLKIKNLTNDDDDFLRRIAIIYNSLPEKDKESVMSYETRWPDLTLLSNYKEYFQLPEKHKKKHKRTPRKSTFNEKDPQCLERRGKLIESLQNKEKFVLDTKFFSLLKNCSETLDNINNDLLEFEKLSINNGKVKEKKIKDDKDKLLSMDSDKISLKASDLLRED